MSYVPHVTLGGVPIIVQSGAVGQAYSQALGEAKVRLSLGALITMTHWGKTIVTLSGNGWKGPAFDRANWSDPQWLRCTAPMEISGATEADRVFTLTSSPRPDVAPWAWALVGNELVRAAVSMLDDVATVTPVAGARLYRVSWMPQFLVKADRPETSNSSEVNALTPWQFVAEEV